MHFETLYFRKLQ